ncbi:hypothetical protein Ciccas_002371 [Cichlidogyrus casuarinus]|uniref:Uncharacterized protein n=1 Tax=Cichlidogyrus casuarinus TaxID=1844966 RepID=A0ABD2QJL7_9PLAT
MHQNHPYELAQQHAVVDGNLVRAARCNFLKELQIDQETKELFINSSDPLEAISKSAIERTLEKAIEDEMKMSVAERRALLIKSQ